MLLRAFAVGVVLGLAAQALPSCGPSRTCSAATCAGCCRADGTCAAGAEARADRQCGRGGDTCVDCSALALSCIDGACTGGTGGGTGGGCGPSTCQGCCAGTSATALCIDPPSNTNCGAQGALCQSCPLGQVCSAGACVSAGDAGVLGLACAGDPDCAALGPAGRCRKTTATGLDVYEGGYCTRDCSTTPECGPGGLCVFHEANSGESGSFCWRRCQTAADCRSPGYDCYALPSGARGCWLSPLPSLDAGPPADRVGSPCGEDSECQGPPSDGFCITPTNADGGASPFVQGYCSATCDDSAHCAVDGGAGCYLFGTAPDQFAACLRHCQGPESGQADCRQGYVCRGVRRADGGLEPDGVCLPDCRNPGAACPGGTTCADAGYCR